MRPRVAERPAWIGYAAVGLAVLFPVVLVVPILSTRTFFISRNEIALASVALDLLRTDKVLFVVVVVFGVIVPWCKSVLSCFYWYSASTSNPGARFELLATLGKFGMLDVMLLAMFVVVFKGTGLGTIELRWGLYLYVFFVVASLCVSVAMRRAVAREAQADRVWPAL